MVAADFDLIIAKIEPRDRPGELISSAILPP